MNVWGVIVAVVWSGLSIHWALQADTAREAIGLAVLFIGLVGPVVVGILGGYKQY